MRREERVTVQGPIKKQQADGMSQGGRGSHPWPALAQDLPPPRSTEATRHPPPPPVALHCSYAVRPTFWALPAPFLSEKVKEEEEEDGAAAVPAKKAPRSRKRAAAGLPRQARGPCCEEEGESEFMYPLTGFGLSHAPNRHFLKAAPGDGAQIGLPVICTPSPDPLPPFTAQASWG